jgi:Mn2+/Fe2+ NRAMP family transporter
MRAAKSLLFGLVLPGLASAVGMAAMLYVASFIGAAFGFGMIMAPIVGGFALWAVLLFLLVMRASDTERQARFRAERDARRKLGEDS